MNDWNKACVIWYRGTYKVCIKYCLQVRNYKRPKLWGYVQHIWTYLTQSTFSCLLLVDGRPELSTSSAAVTPLLSLEKHSQTCVILIVGSPKHTFNISNASVVFFPSLKQNLIQALYSFKSDIFWVPKNRKWNNTHLYVTRHYSTIAPYSKKEMTQQTLLPLLYLLSVLAALVSSRGQSGNYLIVPRIRGVTEKCGQTLGTSSTYQNKKKITISICVRKHLICEL
jgi:hypothetical protein